MNLLHQKAFNRIVMKFEFEPLNTSPANGICLRPAFLTPYDLQGRVHKTCVQKALLTGIDRSVWTSRNSHLRFLVKKGSYRSSRRIVLGQVVSQSINRVWYSTGELKIGWIKFQSFWVTELKFRVLFHKSH